MPAKADLMTRDGLNLFSPVASLVRVGESFFARNSVESQVVLASLRDATDLLRLLLNGGHSAKAGYLAGALRETGRAPLADEIMAAMSGAGYDVRERNPFEAGQVFAAPRQAAAPIVGRIAMLWESMRGGVIENFPKAPGLPKDKGAYLHFIDEIYKSDAYHSLSIEGYSVTPALIERVRQGDWDPDHHEDDRKSRDTLAARRYWQAFQLVKQSVEKVIRGENSGARARRAQGLVSRAVPALRCGGPHRAGRARRIPQQSCVLAHVALRAAAVGSRARRHAGVLQPARKGNGTGRARRPRPLAVRLHPSVPGRQRAHGPVPNERDARFRRLPVDRHPRQGSQRLPGSARPRQHRHGYQTVCGVCRRARALVA
jgi:hypothetical protein